jgi:hypothetical protein
MKRELGDALWWNTVESMPHDEALTMLKDYKAMLLEQNQHKTQYIAAAKLLTRVNDHIKRINLLMDGAAWTMACRNVLPPELYDAVRVEKRRLEGVF